MGIVEGYRIDLIMNVEDEFQIVIPDSEVEQCVTVEKLVDVVLPKLRQSNTEPCPSQHGFYKVRNVLMECLKLKRCQIKLDTKLVDLVERSQRREIWQKLMNIATCPKTSLIRPAWLSHLVFWIIPVLVCLGIVLVGWLPVDLTIILMGIIVAIIGAIVTTPFKTEFPCKAVEVRDLIGFIAPLDSRTWTREEVFLKIRELIAYFWSVDESEVTLETDYVEKYLSK